MRLPGPLLGHCVMLQSWAVSSVQAAGRDNRDSSVSQDDHYDATRTAACCWKYSGNSPSGNSGCFMVLQTTSQDHYYTGHWVTLSSQANFQDDWTLPVYCKLKITCANWIRRIFTEFLISHYALLRIITDLWFGNFCSHSYLQTINNVGNKKSSDFAWKMVSLWSISHSTYSKEGRWTKESHLIFSAWSLARQLPGRVYVSVSGPWLGPKFVTAMIMVRCVQFREGLLWHYFIALLGIIKIYTGIMILKLLKFLSSRQQQKS